MAKGDWIPHREQDFMDLCQKWVSIIEKDESLSSYHWNSSECIAVLEKLRAFITARTAYEADDSSKNRMVKDEAKEAAKIAMRDFANTSIRFNKNMDEAARAALGIRPKDTTPTTQSRPASQPDTVVENTKNRYEHLVKALNRDSGGTAKPADAYGVHYGWQIGGVKPASAEDLPKGKFSRKTSFVVIHSEADKGKPAFYATCYENSKGDAGRGLRWRKRL